MTLPVTNVSYTAPFSATLGILGGGQLGRMLALSAAEFGLQTHIYAPEPDSPAFAVASRFTQGAYDDFEALQKFAAEVDVITFEFESIPLVCLETVAALKPVFPKPQSLGLTQDRLLEKQFIQTCGIATAPFVAVKHAADLVAAVGKLGLPAILKTRRFGYDGKGQVKISAPVDAEGARALLAEIGNAPAILEGFVPFATEISVIAARSQDGAFTAYDVGENSHRDHILHQTHVPAKILPQTAALALAMTKTLAEKLDYVGVMAVELFVLRTQDKGRIEETLVVNEIAPRVHNSGHWTQDGAVTCQFAQHVRAVCGWPLGNVARLADCVMENLIGEDVLKAPSLLAKPNTSLHLYGKRVARHGRKMGHFTTLVFAEKVLP